MEQPVSFFSAGCRLAGDLYVPDDLSSGEKRAGVVLCCGYTGIKDLYLNDMARRFAEAGFVALTFDYKGWGKSDGPPLRLAPYGRVEDTQAALTFLSLRPEVDSEKLGTYGISYGGSTASYTAAIDPRVKAVVSVTGVGNGARWMRRVRLPWDYRELVERGSRDRERQVMTGESELVDRGEVLQQDPQSLAISAKARAARPGAAMQVPLEMIHETIGFNPEWVVDRIAPRASLFITSDRDELVLPEESEELFKRAGEPKKLVVLRGYGHYEVFTPPALDEVMAEALPWYRRYLVESPRPTGRPASIPASRPCESTRTLELRGRCVRRLASRVFRCFDRPNSGASTHAHRGKCTATRHLTVQTSSPGSMSPPFLHQVILAAAKDLPCLGREYRSAQDDLVICGIGRFLHGQVLTLSCHRSPRDKRTTIAVACILALTHAWKSVPDEWLRA
jgi:uncharacterized protein